MTKNPLIVSGPYTHEKLAIFLFHGSDEVDGGGYASLTEAFEKKYVLVHETGTVGQLEAKNFLKRSIFSFRLGTYSKAVGRTELSASTLSFPHDRCAFLCR